MIDFSGYDYGISADMAELERLRTINAELLAALEATIPLLEGFEEGDDYDDDETPIVTPVLNQARAAIAKARATE